jgi:hypothetical protein
MKTFYIVTVSIVAVLIIIGFIVLMLMVSTNIFSSIPSTSGVLINPSEITFDTAAVSVTGIQSNTGVSFTNVQNIVTGLFINFDKPINGKLDITFDMPTPNDLTTPSGKVEEIFIGLDLQKDAIITTNKSNTQIIIPTNLNTKQVKLFISPESNIIFSNLKITNTN